MRDSEGNKLMPLWKYKSWAGDYIIAAWTRKEVHELLLKSGIDWPYSLNRIKNCFASFKEGKILT